MTKFVSKESELLRTAKFTLPDPEFQKKELSINSFLAQFVLPGPREAVEDHLRRIFFEGAFTKFAKAFPFPHLYIQQPAFTFAVNAPAEMKNRKMPALFLVEIYLAYVDYYEAAFYNEIDTCALFFQVKNGQYDPKGTVLSDLAKQLLLCAQVAKAHREKAVAKLRMERDWKSLDPKKDRLVLQDGLLRWCAAWELQIHKLSALIRVARRIDFVATTKSMQRRVLREEIHARKTAFLQCEWEDGKPATVYVINSERDFPAELSTTTEDYSCLKALLDACQEKESGYMCKYWVNLDITGMHQLTRNIYVHTDLEKEEMDQFQQVLQQFMLSTEIKKKKKKKAKGGEAAT